jgi:predicted permease
MRAPGAQNGAARLIRVLCRLLPADLREGYGEDIETCFAVAYEAKRSGDGRLAAARFALRSVIDLLATNVRERSRSDEARGVRSGRDGRRSRDPGIGQDVRYALRSVRTRPLFAAVVVVTLGLGIGGTTAFFTLVDAALLRGLPFPDADRLVQVRLLAEDEPEGDGVWSYPKYVVLRTESRAFDKIAGFSRWSGNLAGGGEPERLSGERVTAGYFDVLGIEPRLGRVFTEEESSDPGSARVAVISGSLWLRMFDGAADVIGRTVRLDGEPVAIVGVLPAGFHGLTGVADVFVPIATVGHMLNGQWAHFMTVIARVRPDLPLEGARTETAALGARIDELYRSPRGGAWTADLQLLEELRIDPAIRRSMLVLFGAVTCVLLIACANVANLMMARAAGRKREIAVRLALGAGRRRLIRQLMTEAMVLASMGGVLGVVLGWAGIRVLASSADWVSSTRPAQTRFGLFSPEAVTLDAGVLVFAVVATLVTGLLFGIAPALQASRANLTSDLRQAGGEGAGFRVLTARSALVVAEIAAAFVLLVGSGLMLGSLKRLLDVDAGVDAHNLLTAQVSLPAADGASSPQFWQQLRDRLSSLAGAESAALADCPPLIGLCNVRPFRVEGAEQLEPQPVGVHYVTAGYFRALGVDVRQGRAFSDGDRAGSPPVVIINETAARRFFPGQEPVGKWIRVGGGFADGAEIVGVVADQRFAGLEVPPQPDVYVSWEQVPQASAYIFVRTAGEPALLAAALRSEVRRLDPDLPLYDVKTMEERVGAATAASRLTAMLLGLFAGVALLLALMGIYGVVAGAVAQRAREIGVRVALGAPRSGVIALVLRQGAILIVPGVLLGIAGAWSATRVLRSLLYEIDPGDPVVFAYLTLLTAGVTMLACAAPAVRALRVDPVVALRSE